MIARSLALALSSSLALSSPAAAAGASFGPESEPSDEDALYSEAEALYQKGKGEFETADYAAAIETWTKAYTMLPSTHESARVKVLLLYDIATARELAFDVDGEVAHLRQAKILLENFDANIPALYEEGVTADEERKRVRERIAKLEQKIEEAQAGPGPLVDEPEPKPDETPEGPDAAKKRKALVITGATLFALGGASLGLMTAGLVIGDKANDISDIDDDDIEGRRDQFARGRTGNMLAYVGGAAAGVFLITGTVLLVLGKKKSPSKTALTPALGPTFAGMSLSRSF
jgi:tetratricopeptide (TPR) repeat protein